MAIKVLVSKEFVVEDTEGAERLKALRKHGWSVYCDPGEPRPEPEPEKKAATGEEVSAILKSLKKRHGLRLSDASRLTGVAQSTICRWRDGTRTPSERMWGKFVSLSERSRSLPPGDKTLKLESLSTLIQVRAIRSVPCLDTAPR